MKIKVTKKSVRENCGVILRVGCCGMQYLLRGHAPFAYSVRAEGWACDYYDISGIIISTGYAPIGHYVDHELVQTYDNKARTIWENYSLSYEQQKDHVDRLLHAFLAEVTQ